MEIHSLLVGDAKGRNNDLLQVHKGEFLVGVGSHGHRHVHQYLGRIGSKIIIITPVHDFTGERVGRATQLFSLVRERLNQFETTRNKGY